MYTLVPWGSIEWRAEQHCLCLCLLILSLIMCLKQRSLSCSATIFLSTGQLFLKNAIILLLMLMLWECDVFGDFSSPNPVLDRSLYWTKALWFAGGKSSPFVSWECWTKSVWSVSEIRGSSQNISPRSCSGKKPSICCAWFDFRSQEFQISDSCCGYE